MRAMSPDDCIGRAVIEVGRARPQAPERENGARIGESSRTRCEKLDSSSWCLLAAHPSESELQRSCSAMLWHPNCCDWRQYSEGGSPDAGQDRVPRNEQQPRARSTRPPPGQSPVRRLRAPAAVLGRHRGAPPPAATRRHLPRADIVERPRWAAEREPRAWSRHRPGRVPDGARHLSCRSTAARGPCPPYAAA